tara:strand:- start:18341 stop:19387 length:1047 start_codon:yes stop_codon:yes gene_type:complete
MRAENRKLSNIAAANAIEALGCLWAYRETRFESNPRLRGSTKLHGNDDGFKSLSAPGAYVSQPMRMATGQALYEFGLVESDGSRRFNSYRCSDIGRKLIELSYSSGQGRPDPIGQFINWVQGRSMRGMNPYLLPTEGLSSGAAKFLLELLASNSTHRSKLLRWMGTLPETGKVTWSMLKKANLEEEHFAQIRDGANFVAMRDAAIALLEGCESIMSNDDLKALKLSNLAINTLKVSSDKLKNTAKTYSDGWSRIDYSSNEARQFAEICIQSDLREVLQQLVSRDNVVLRLVDDEIKRGPAFDQNFSLSDDDDDDEETALLQWPDKLSPRIQNLFELMTDLKSSIGSYQ